MSGGKCRAEVDNAAIVRVQASPRPSPAGRGSKSLANGRADHFQDSSQAVVAAQAAFVEGGAGDGLPFVAGAVVFEVIRNSSQCRIVLIVAAAEFVDD